MDEHGHFCYSGQNKTIHQFKGNFEFNTTDWILNSVDHDLDFHLSHVYD
jgi:hypothetical protein